MKFKIHNQISDDELKDKIYNTVKFEKAEEYLKEYSKRINIPYDKLGINVKKFDKTSKSYKAALEALGGEEPAGYYDSKSKSIEIGESISRETLQHEFGHAIDIFLGSKDKPDASGGRYEHSSKNIGSFANRLTASYRPNVEESLKQEKDARVSRGVDFDKFSKNRLKDTEVFADIFRQGDETVRNSLKRLMGFY